MIKKILFISLILVSVTNANSEYQLPSGYNYGLNSKNNIQIYVEREIAKKGPPTEFITMVPYTSKNINDVWFTSCSKKMIKGIPEIQCDIMKDNLHVLVSNKNTYPYIIYFDSKTMMTIAGSKSHNLKLMEKETNYKIDNSQTHTLPMIVVGGDYSSNAFVRDAKKGEVLYYSIKDGDKYKSYTVNLIGFKESIEFSNEFILINK